MSIESSYCNLRYTIVPFSLSNAFLFILRHSHLFEKASLPGTTFIEVVPSVVTRVFISKKYNSFNSISLLFQKREEISLGFDKNNFK